MSPQPSDLIGKNFLLKRIGDRLYLPCTKDIPGDIPPYLPPLSYYLCQTTSFDEAFRQLFLAHPKSYDNYFARDYQTSIELNSDLILALDVQTFAILPPAAPSRNRSVPYDWGDLSKTPEWKPIQFENVLASKHPEDAPATPSLARITRDEDCRIALADLRFEDGKASFTRFIYPTLGEIQFEIHHPAIRREFDAIKEYFEQVLGSKTIPCHITLEATGNVIHSQTARFCGDDLINGSLIEKIENRSIKQHILNGDDGVFLLEEKLKEVIQLDNPPNDFDSLLDRLQQIKQSKHYYHLRHLSSLHDVTAFRLRMTGPQVSFIFVVKGSSHYYVVWETYQTEEATYVWKLTGEDKKSRQDEMTKLLDLIMWLHEANKEEYLRSKPTNFKRLEHDYEGERFGLEKWKSELSLFIR